MTRRRMTMVLLCLALAACGGTGDDKATDVQGADAPSGADGTGDLSGDVPATFCPAGESRCTDDGAVETCLADGSAWETGEACHDGNPCTTDGCLDGSCTFLPLCDDGDGCTLDICLPFSAECLHEPDPGATQCCQLDADCDDGNPDSTDLCDVATGSCINQVENAAIEFLFQFGGKGAEDGQFTSPKGIHVLADGRILIADSGNHRVLLLAPDGEQLLAVTEAYDKPVKAPACVYEAPDGTLFVCDTGNDRLLLLDSTGAVTGVWPPADSGVTLFMAPSDVAANGSGDVYVTDGPGEEFDSGNRLIRMNDKGQVKKEQGKTGEAAGNFDKPAGVAVSEGGNVFVADQGNHRVQVFEPALGDPIAVFGVEGEGEGEFKGVSDIAMDSRNLIYLADNGNQRIQVFDVCQPDCTERLCGSDGCLGSCGDCPSFATCGDDGMCEGWVAPGEAACEDKTGTEEPGCGGCPAEACVCNGEGTLAPENFVFGGESDPFCCETEWDNVCVFEAQYVCGYECPLPEDIEWPVLEPTFGPIAAWDHTDGGKLTSPIKLALAKGGFVYVLDTVKALVYVYRVKLP
jgi:sugar lactone lactonase YvrE